MIRASAEKVSPAERQSLHREALQQLRGELVRHLGAEHEGIHIGVRLVRGGGTALAVRAAAEPLAERLRAALPEKLNGFPIQVEVASGEEVPLASEARQLVREQTAGLSLSKVYQRRIDRALIPEFAEAWPGGSGIRGQYVDNDWQLFLGEGPRVSHVGSRTLQDGRFYDYKTGGNGTEAWGTVTTASANGAVVSQVREHRGDVNQMEAVAIHVLARFDAGFFVKAKRLTPQLMPLLRLLAPRHEELRAGRTAIDNDRSRLPQCSYSPAITASVKSWVVALPPRSPVRTLPSE